MANDDITWVRPEHRAASAAWRKYRDFCKGAEAVKAAGNKYLPYLDPTDKSTRNRKRNEDYLSRAVFYAIAGNTKIGMLGMAYRKDPTFNGPEKLKYLLDNADGAGNAEAEGVSISRLDTGVYELTGSAGLASDGWQLLPPMDPGGMGELGVVEAEQTENGGLTIRLFERKYLLGDDGEIVKTKGEPMDVPVNSWIDVRLDMPADSLFMQRMNQGLQP
ncbi:MULTISPECIES: phage tail fiber protein [Enterobacter cloacae complex]|uniref:phage tail fiber protein n=1 Tax=Enterobacter cloacae complex TaxID=354276 RepID=UPI0010107345|nr:MULTISPECIES: hypothetical protein [Enterobacter cloacae complex]MDQ6581782.1 hypothetical protein [Enterobacter hormaechei]RYA44760.1 hypothetical protein DD603_02370 [Enterobacter cloacae complex sp. 2DZ2F2B]RYA45125.1 hypothetical protein DD605_08495 [Enterobacter cloacae complex sp. 3DZ3S2B]